MATAQNVTNWFYLQKVSYRCIFKVRRLQLDSLNCFRMVGEKQEGVVFCPPGKIGLTVTFQNDEVIIYNFPSFILA